MYEDDVETTVVADVKLQQRLGIDQTDSVDYCSHWSTFCTLSCARPFYV